MTAGKGATIIVEGSFREGYEAYFDTYSKTVRDLLNKYDSTTIPQHFYSKVSMHTV